MTSTIDARPLYSRYFSGYFAVTGGTISLSPQPLGCDIRHLAAAPELGPDDVLGHHRVARESAEAAVARRDDPAAVAHGVDRLADAVGDHLGMLDVVGRRIDHARQQQEPGRQLGALQRRIFVLVAWIGELDAE